MFKENLSDFIDNKFRYKSQHDIIDVLKTRDKASIDDIIDIIMGPDYPKTEQCRVYFQNLLKKMAFKGKCYMVDDNVFSLKVKEKAPPVRNIYKELLDMLEHGAYFDEIMLKLFNKIDTDSDDYLFVANALWSLYDTDKLKIEKRNGRHFYYLDV